MTDNEFVTILAVMRVDHAERVSNWCARQELTADFRETIAHLNALGSTWTEEMIKVGSLLTAMIETLEPSGGTQ